MASYHCSVKVGGKGKGVAHAEYISREGKYATLRDGEKLEAKESGNMPAWAVHSPPVFWQAADEHERANGAVYREIEIALPRELTSDQRIALVRDFVSQEIGDRHAYTWAIHTPKAKLESGEQPHAHIMYSERTRDGIERDPEQYFKRYNAKSRERGGCKKDSAGTDDRLQATRERWATVQNQHLQMHSHEERVDHRSLKNQGLDHTAERHFGPVHARQLSSDDRQALALHRDSAKRAAEAKREVWRTIPDIAAELRQQFTLLQKRASEILDVVKTGAGAFLARFEAHKLSVETQRQARQAELEKERVQERARQAVEDFKQKALKPQQEKNRDRGYER